MDTEAVIESVGVKKNIRYVIITLLFIVGAINYADRATFSIAGPSMMKSMNLDVINLGYLMSTFGWAYVLGAYLVNTGWNGTGKRISIQDTRKIIDAILNGTLDQMEMTTLPIFNLAIPTELPGVDPHILDPRNTYADAGIWESKAGELAQKFISNFDAYTDTELGMVLIQYGPQL